MHVAELNSSFEATRLRVTVVLDGRPAVNVLEDLENDF